MTVVAHYFVSNWRFVPTSVNNFCPDNFYLTSKKCPVIFFQVAKYKDMDLLNFIMNKNLTFHKKEVQICFHNGIFWKRMIVPVIVKFAQLVFVVKIYLAGQNLHICNCIFGSFFLSRYLFVMTYVCPAILVEDITKTTTTSTARTTTIM